jgi:Skp family chaperone for outer membrane proteins
MSCPRCGADHLGDCHPSDIIEKLTAQLKAAQDRVQALIDSNARLIEQKAAEKERREDAEEALRRIDAALDAEIQPVIERGYDIAEKVLKAHFAKYQGSENDG